MNINWSLLVEVLVVAFGTALGTVVLFSLGVRGWSDHADARAKGGSSVVGVAMAAVSFALCAAIVAFGLWIIVAG